MTKFKNSNREKTQNVTKLQNSNCYNLTNLDCEKETKASKSKTHIVNELNNSNHPKNQKLKLLLKSTTQTVTKIKKILL